MSLIITENVYVWCGDQKCVGILDGRYGCGTTLGGAFACYSVLSQMLRDLVPPLSE